MARKSLVMNNYFCSCKTPLIAGNSLEPKVLRVIIFRIGQSAAKPVKEGSSTIENIA